MLASSFFFIEELFNLKTETMRLVFAGEEEELDLTNNMYLVLRGGVRVIS